MKEVFREDNIQAVKIKDIDSKVESLFGKYNCLEDFNKFKNLLDTNTISYTEIDNFLSAIMKFSDDDRNILMSLWSERANSV